MLPVAFNATLWIYLIVSCGASIHAPMIGRDKLLEQFRKYYAGSGREIDHFPFQEAQQFSLSLLIEEARMSLPQ